MGMMYEMFDYVPHDNNVYLFEIGELVTPIIDFRLVLTEDHKTDRDDPAINLYSMPEMGDFYVVKQRCFSHGVEYISLSNVSVIHYPAELFKSKSMLN